METENSIPRWQQKLNNYILSLNRLTEIVEESKKRELNEFELDCVIQRFEFTHESAWKLIKKYAEYQGFDNIIGSRDASRWAYENQLICNPEIWMSMIRARKEISNNYDLLNISKITNIITNEYYNNLSYLLKKITPKKNIIQSKKVITKDL